MRKLVMPASALAGGGRRQGWGPLKAAREEIKEMEFDTLAIGGDVF